MTDRYYALIVGLAQDIRSDDAEPVMNAIRQLKGVLTVEPLVADPGTWMAEQRARTEIIGRVLDVIRPRKESHDGP